MFSYSGGFAQGISYSLRRRNYDASIPGFVDVFLEQDVPCDNCVREYTDLVFGDYDLFLKCTSTSGSVCQFKLMMTATFCSCPSIMFETLDCIVSPVTLGVYGLSRDSSCSFCTPGFFCDGS